MGNLTACDDVVIWAIDLKRGMELRPWASCIARLATTPAEARALLADAVAVLEARAGALAEVGKRVWEPSALRPALVIIVDEYAELAEAAPAAVTDADSVARRGRAVAVTLIAATQRPTQKAMGQGALRSQMDVRISFRVRERKDVELILGQGMLAAGWHAHTLNAPGKFLISAPEHDTPRRARCYLSPMRQWPMPPTVHCGIPAISRCRIARRRQPARPGAPRTSPRPSGDEPVDAAAPGATWTATGTHRARLCGHALSRRRRREHRARADGGNWHEPPVGLPAPRGPGPQRPGHPGEPRTVARLLSVIVYVYVSRASARKGHRSAARQRQQAVTHRNQRLPSRVKVGGHHDLHQ